MALLVRGITRPWHYSSVALLVRWRYWSIGLPVHWGYCSTGVTGPLALLLSRCFHLILRGFFRQHIFHGFDKIIEYITGNPVIP